MFEDQPHLGLKVSLDSCCSHAENKVTNLSRFKVDIDQNTIWTAKKTGKRVITKDDANGARHFDLLLLHRIKQMHCVRCTSSIAVGGARLRGVTLEANYDETTFHIVFGYHQ